ncbi:MAG TPA: DUF2961 domain-containing protein [Bryobacteraceae bacterium]|nr:DUF2961 domain-containing protein [Bryobacteraceae bacterium]
MKNLAPVLSIVILALAAPDQGRAARPFEEVVRDVHVLRNYRAGKNSYVESTKRHAGWWTGRGFRATLLDIKGTGSVRHIWSTWMKDGPYFEWQFFVDGETEPSIRGRFDELVAAADHVKSSPAIASPVPRDPAKRDHNLYLPIPFEKSIRIDVVQLTDSVDIFFTQIDYRTEDDSLKGVRLRSRQREGRVELYYEGWQPPAPRPPIRTETIRFDRRRIAPGERVLIGTATGPAIVRRLDLNAPISHPLRMLVRYDGASGYAINAPTARYFGEFQGASFERIDENRAVNYLPMPFREKFEFYLENEGSTPVEAVLSLDIERVTEFRPDWGYLHAWYNRTASTNGHSPHQVLYTRGRGHWLGMSLFKTGHDHGGGDFAIVDGESERPAFLHGINGEDYFTFAFFGAGQHQPYAQAITNDRGRYRHHLENPYPFQHSFHMEWATFANLQPESVAFWYQDSPEDLTVPAGDPSITELWETFGFVPVPLEATKQKRGLYVNLPSVADLDAGKTFEAGNIKERFPAGWLWETSNGPGLNLTYISRHGAETNGEMYLGGNGHAYLARKRFIAKQAEQLEAVLSHDDPIEIELNGKIVYQEPSQCAGFCTHKITLPVRAGENELVVRLTNYFNQTFVWAGFNLWIRNSAGQPVRLSDLHR